MSTSIFRLSSLRNFSTMGSVRSFSSLTSNRSLSSRPSRDLCITDGKSKLGLEICRIASKNGIYPTVLTTNSSESEKELLRNGIQCRDIIQYNFSSDPIQCLEEILVSLPHESSIIHNAHPFFLSEPWTTPLEIKNSMPEEEIKANTMAKAIRGAELISTVFWVNMSQTQCQKNPEFSGTPKTLLFIDKEWDVEVTKTTRFFSHFLTRIALVNRVSPSKSHSKIVKVVGEIFDGDEQEVTMGTSIKTIANEIYRLSQGPFYDSDGSIKILGNYASLKSMRSDEKARTLNLRLLHNLKTISDRKYSIQT